MIKKCQEKGIPFFVVIGTDKHAYSAINNYILEITRDSNVDVDFVIEVSEIWRDFLKFKKDNPQLVRTPD